MIKNMIALIKHHNHINWALADQAMVSGSNFLIGILLARSLGIAEFGRFTIAWMLVLFIQSIQHAIINSPMLSIGPQQQTSEQEKYYGSVFLMQFSLAIVSSLIAFLGMKIGEVFFPSWGIEQLIWPLTIVVFFSQIQDFLRRYYFTIELARISFFGDFIRYFGLVILLFWLLFINQFEVSVSYVLWCFCCLIVIASIFMMIFIKRVYFSYPFLKIVFTRHWKFSKWLIGASFLQWASGQMMFIIAGIVLGLQAVGVLKAAQNIVGLFHILFLGLENFLPIRLSKLYRLGEIYSANVMLNKITWGLVGFSIFVFLVMIVFSQQVMGFLYGVKYVEYGYILTLFSLAYVFSSLAVISRIVLRAKENSFPIFISTVVATFWTIIFAWPLASYFGLGGITFGLLAYFAIMAIIPYAYLVKNNISFWPILPKS